MKGKKSETLIELENKLEEMEGLIKAQKFSVVDAHKFMMIGLKVHNRFEELIKSRDMWRDKYRNLKNGQPKNK